MNFTALLPRVTEERYLEEDLKLGEGITGGFAAKSPKTQEDRTIQPKDNSSENNKPNNKVNIFEKYKTDSKVSVTAGHSKEKGIEMD